MQASSRVRQCPQGGCNDLEPPNLVRVGRRSKKTRFAGVVPQDDQSRQRLADDAYDMALSWGKPAGRIALLAVDTFFFLIIFRFSGYDFSKILVGRGMEQLRSLEFW
ncbi:unnamed protein product [Ascophyllum nodosum]